MSASKAAVAAVDDRGREGLLEDDDAGPVQQGPGQFGLNPGPMARIGVGADPRPVDQDALDDVVGPREVGRICRDFDDLPKSSIEQDSASTSRSRVDRPAPLANHSWKVLSRRRCDVAGITKARRLPF